MATINFSLRSDKNPSKIYVRLRNGRSSDMTVYTGYIIDPKHWNSTKGEVKQSALFDDKINLSRDLNNLKNKVIEELNSSSSKGITINKQWLESVISNEDSNIGETESPKLIYDLMTEYKNELKFKINPKTNKPISENTIRGFAQVIERLKNFEKHVGIKYLVSEVDLNFKFEFVNYMINVSGFSQNTINKSIKQLKTVCLDAIDKGFSVNIQVRSTKFNHPREVADFVTITEAEINQIRKFKGTDYHMNARDWLIIGCWTGCRVNDLMQLSMNNINETEKGQKFIRYTQSKTNKQVDLPIHPHVEEIIKRLKGFPRPISDQRFNEWIKDVCRDSGLTQEVYGSRQNPESHKKEVGAFKKYELIRSHTCRRSFATNHYDKLPNKKIMAVTGHSTEQMLLSYIGETKNDHIDDFLNVWNNNL
jgi:integrase